MWCVKSPARRSRCNNHFRPADSGVKSRRWLVIFVSWLGSLTCYSSRIERVDGNDMAVMIRLTSDRHRQSTLEIRDAADGLSSVVAAPRGWARACRDETWRDDSDPLRRMLILIRAGHRRAESAHVPCQFAGCRGPERRTQANHFHCALYSPC
ncbi:uncharacterized protein C8Q71DRAFT_253876 [Rhodofomes roseus]|uniref:Uncharacterized protein n=1 Tax=Rhodofomes roseus TaxID=34475 RepID=A0ABQ8K5X6_9APHY|nr:uncharacterized protein C8Q71DRAFT_253876 [Rhodofomes roseus]KAH9832478.1 hypothetical protein C8Q71DRAFT_253876 [Rhodofomes roseus]